MQHVTEEQTFGESEERKKRKQHLKLLISVLCVLETLTLGPQRTLRVLCPVAESHYSMKQKDCGGIHLMLPIV